MKIAVYNQSGVKSQETVTSRLFEGPSNPKLISEAVYIYQSNLRQAPAKTLDRSEVAGSGIKPWRQKGTGRARAGSRRSPIWRGGGITFGPTREQHFHKDIPSKKRTAALRSALAGKTAEEVIIIKNIKLDKISTKQVKEILDKVGAIRNVLIITEEKNEILEKSIRNLADVMSKNWNDLNILNVLKAQKIIFLGEALDKLTKKLGTGKGVKEEVKKNQVKKPVKTSPDSPDAKKSGTPKKEAK